ncbi:MAG: CmcJ/NvfI family oxidoreductase [Gammaproteobacteria bacterium]|nr:CmcJ/NvfI family oxidoreductase [Gammaproteobacteria bacterium]
MRRGLPPLIDAPFVVAESVFVSPKYRGTRLNLREAFDPDGDRSALCRQQIRIHDARSLARTPDIEREGFALIDAPVDVDFGAPAQLTGRYYEHCASLVKAATGCVAAGAFQHGFRVGKVTGAARQGLYGVVVHADHSPFIEDFTDVPEGRHFALFNVWRGTIPGREIELGPLALCDSSTVSARDIVYADCLRRTEPRTRVIDCRLIHDPGQSWYYFPRMHPGEALIFKQYDSRRENAGERHVFHSAFRDPTVREDAPLRKSVEVRVLAVLPDADPERERRKTRFQAGVPNKRLDGTVSTWRQEPAVDWNGSQGGSPRVAAGPEK